MMKILFRVLLVLMLTMSANISISKLDSIHYLPPLHSRVNNQIKDHYLYLSTPELTPFPVILTDGGGTVLSTIIISDGAPARYDVGNGQLGGSQLFVSRADVFTALNDKGIIAKGDYKFYAEVRTRSAAQAESYTGKGLSAVGREFRLGGFPQTSNGSADRNFTVGIMSLENNNIITISDFPPGLTFVEPVGTNAPAGNLQITLNEGETFVLTGYSNVPQNLNGIIGALAQSTGDIVITNGNLNGTIHPNSGSRDNGLDQTVPVGSLGNKHVVIEGNGDANMERPFVIAHFNNTEIFINGNAVPVATLNAGDYFLVPNMFYQGGGHRNMFIETSQASYIYQALAGGVSHANGGLNIIPPIHCRLSNSINLIPDINRIGSTVYNGGLFILTEAGATVTVNGALIGGSEAVTGANYETYKLNGVTGDQVIVSDRSLMVGVFGSSGSAAYSGYYSGFADIPEGEVFISESIICADQSDSVVFVGKNGTLPYIFYYTLNGDTLSSASNSDTLILQIDNTISDTLNYNFFSISSFDVDNVNSCLFNVNSQDQIIILPLPQGEFFGDTVVCQDETDPTVTFIGANGTAPYTFTYSINNGATPARARLYRVRGVLIIVNPFLN